MNSILTVTRRRAKFRRVAAALEGGRSLDGVLRAAAAARRHIRSERDG